MSDQYVPEMGQEQQVVQPEVTENTTPAYLTRAEAEALVKQGIDEALNRQVGLYTKGTEKLRSRLEELERNIPRMQKAGVTVDNAQIQAMRNDILQESLLETEEAPQAKQTAAPQPAPQGLDPSTVNQIANSILQSMNVRFDPNAPEVAQIKTNGTAEEYLTSLMQAANAYKQRIAEKPNPEARMPGMVSGTATGPKDWKAEYNKEILEAQKDPINGVEKSLQVRRKYRQMGYSV